MAKRYKKKLNSQRCQTIPKIKPQEEGIIVNAQEHEILWKYRKWLQKRFNVQIWLPTFYKSHSDIIFARIEGVFERINHVKRFLRIKMSELADRDFASPSEDNVELIIISDSENEEESKQICKLKSKDIAVTNQRDVFQNSTVVSVTGNNALPSSSTSHTLNSSCTTQVKRKFNRRPTSKESSNEITSTTDNDLVMKKAKLSESVLIIEEPVTSSQSADTLSESVLIIEEHRTNNQPVPDFIPLVHSTESANKTVKHVNKRPWFGSTNMSLINADDDDDIKIIDDLKPNVVSHHNNLQIIHDPKPIVMPLGDLRPIVIDGSNVAIEHGKFTNAYSIKGIKLAIDYFLNRGHTQITAFVPKYRKNRGEHRTFPTTDLHLLKELEKRQFVVFTPSRRILDKAVSSYDDRFIVKLAASNGGIIVSNDNFRDLLNVNEECKKAICERLLMFCFVGDLFMVPDDPLGRDGPPLDEFLRFVPESQKQER